MPGARVLKASCPGDAVSRAGRGGAGSLRVLTRCLWLVLTRAYKKIDEDDLKFPLIYGEGKKARVMATIGVTRGLGDHDLRVFSSNIHIKPFLSCFPEVRVYDLTQYEHCPDDVLVLGTDGLWDVTNDKEVAAVVMEVLTSYEPNDPCRYTMVAQELVVRSRGVLKERGWRLANDKLGSGDDISVFVIPLGGPGNYT
ncbi:PREDICTED: protein phosphatase 1J-like [Chlamydotis macqueenii]|uniref:protein phosphatase 1J-like n=1 Tax=Chlamydotis macqueenii TaxID=187382 RepID=UPI00052A11DA|nr:PREDICTED: protein phosphatase 1J-like [Chlamydotis macqueenii]